MSFHDTGLNRQFIVSGIVGETAATLTSDYGPGIAVDDQAKIETAANRTLSHLWKTELSWLEPYQQVEVLEAAAEQDIPEHAFTINVTNADRDSDTDTITTWEDVVAEWVKTGLTVFATHVLATRAEFDDAAQPASLPSEGVGPADKSDVANLVDEITRRVEKKPENQRRDATQNAINDHPISHSRSSYLVAVTTVLMNRYDIPDSTLTQYAARSTTDWEESIYNMYGIALQYAVLENVDAITGN